MLLLGGLRLPGARRPPIATKSPNRLIRQIRSRIGRNGLPRGMTKMIRSGLLVAALIGPIALAASPSASADVTGVPSDWHDAVCQHQDDLLTVGPFKNSKVQNTCGALLYGGVITQALYTGPQAGQNLEYDCAHYLSPGAPLAIGRDSNGLWVFMAVRDRVGADSAKANLAPLGDYGFKLLVN